MEKVLILATVPSMIGQFNMENIEILKELGYEIHVACNFEDTSVWDTVHIRKFKSTLGKMNVICHHVSIGRSPYNVINNYHAFKQVLKLAEKEHFAFLHCHTPVAGIVGRVVGKKTKTKVVYTAHGFHFFSGAPLKNWIFYFPVEWLCSCMTNVLITINQEDYQFAKNMLKAQKTVYLPGVGIDIKKYETLKGENIRKIKRKELGIEDSTKVLLSVGELNKNKNHQVVIKALARMREQEFVYLICGIGEIKEYLQRLINQYHLEDKVRLLGYRNDMEGIYKAADIFIFPSKREGLPVALMEAMANELPVVCTKIRGNRELIKEREGGYLIRDTSDVSSFYGKILEILSNTVFMENAGKINHEVVKKYDIKCVSCRMRRIYLFCGKK